MRGTTDFTRKSAVVRMLAHSKAFFFSNETLSSNDEGIHIKRRLVTFF